MHTILKHILVGHPFSLLGFAGGVMLVTAGTQLIEDHEVRIPTVASVGTVVVVGAWQLSRRFQRIDDQLASLNKEIKSLSCHRGKPDDCPEQRKTDKTNETYD